MNKGGNGTHPEDNRLLALLPAAAHAAVRPRLEPVTCQVRARLFHADEPIRPAVFLTSGLVSIVAFTGDGGTVEVGPVGDDGLVDLPLVLGDDRTPLESRALRLTPEEARRYIRQGWLNLLVPREFVPKTGIP